MAYLPVRESHFGVNDALVVLLMTAGLVPCVRIARGGTRRDYRVAGALARLAFYASLRQSATRIAEFSATAADPPPAFAYDRFYGPFDQLFAFERPGPLITVYRLDRSP